MKKAALEAAARLRFAGLSPPTTATQWRGQCSTGPGPCCWRLMARGWRAWVARTGRQAPGTAARPARCPVPGALAALGDGQAARFTFVVEAADAVGNSEAGITTLQRRSSSADGSHFLPTNESAFSSFGPMHC